MENTPDTPASITRYRRVREQAAEIAALRRENDRLQDPELPEYVRLCGTITKGMGLTANQTIDLARSMHDFAESRDEPMCLDMCEAFIEYLEGRALAAAHERSCSAARRGLARVAESPRPVLVLAFRKPSKLSARTANQTAVTRG